MRPTGQHLRVVQLGRTSFDEALAVQLDLVRKRREGSVADTLLLTEHNPVVTLGRAAEPSDRPNPLALALRGIALREATRGGKATYHGPGQLVGYPIIDLRARASDLHRYVADLEASLIATLARLGVAAESRPALRGVWVGKRKLAAIGVAVRGWIAYHGFCLNVAGDLSPFDLIAPCGMSGLEVTSIERELGREVSWDRLCDGLAADLSAHLGYQARTAVEG